MRYTHVLASIPLRVIAVCSVALLALLAHDAAAPRPALANPISVWVININVSAALEGSGFCDPSSAAFYASSLDAIAAGSAGQVSDASQYAGSACLIVKTDGSTSPITVNGRGLVCDTACDGTAASAITPETVGGSAYAAEIIDGYAAGYTSAPITVTQDNVAVDTAPIVPVHQAHDIMLSVTKPTVQ